MEFKSQTEIIIDKILDAIESGISVKEIKKDYKKYITSGITKKIIINTGGEGLKVSYEILEEMKKRGDKLATKLIENDNFYVISNFGITSTQIKDGYYFSNRKKQWTYFEKSDHCFYDNYDRENKILIDIIEENKIKNIGGWELKVFEVPIEDWTYQIIKTNDHWGSEEIEFFV